MGGYSLVADSHPNSPPPSSRAKKKLHITSWSDFTKKSAQDLYSVCQDGITFDGKEGHIVTNGVVPFDGQHSLGDSCIVIMVDSIVGLSKVVDEVRKEG